MKIIEYSLNSREWFKSFEAFFYTSQRKNSDNSWSIGNEHKSLSGKWAADWQFINDSSDNVVLTERSNIPMPSMNQFDCNYPDGFLGKNISHAVVEPESFKDRFLILFDTDDDGGTTALSCKLIWRNFNLLLIKHKIAFERVLVFKRELCYEKEMSEYNPFIERCMPLGMLPYCPNPVFRNNNDLLITSEMEEPTEASLKRFSDSNTAVFKWKNDPIFIDDCFNVKNKDIDVFWAGTVPDMTGDPTPPFWTRGKSLDSYSYLDRHRMFQELKAIKKRRSDINIVCLDKKVTLKEYFSLIGRSKICIEAPGVGQLNKRFIEYMILEKCILRMRLRCELPYDLKENVHYASFGNDVKNLEISIDDLLDNPYKIESFEKNIKQVNIYHSYGYLQAYIIAATLNFMKSKMAGKQWNPRAIKFQLGKNS